MSAQSGIKTFRDSGGLWENYPVQEVASIEGWHKNPQLMLTFYNERRAQLKEAQPNEGHRVLSRLEKDFDVYIVTQNVDNLHERAGSSRVLHLHGELTKARSVNNPYLITDIGYEPIHWGDIARSCLNGGIIIIVTAVITICFLQSRRHTRSLHRKGTKKEKQSLLEQ